MYPLLAPFTGQETDPVYLRIVDLPAGSSYVWHHHERGEFVYSFSGLMEMRMADSLILAPPRCGIWLPPGHEHSGQTRFQTCHASVYVAPSLCPGFPERACALTVGPLLRALLDHLRRRGSGSPSTPEEHRLVAVLLDQLRAAPNQGSFLPMSTDPVLGPLLRQLERSPEEDCTLAELARRAHTTERTLTRRCNRDLGMSFREWRQRLRVVWGIKLLETPATVESIALELGYGSSSAFIAMFRRLVGVTPETFRRRARAGRDGGHAVYPTEPGAAAAYGDILPPEPAAGA